MWLREYAVLLFVLYCSSAPFCTCDSQYSYKQYSIVIDAGISEIKMSIYMFVLTELNDLLFYNVYNKTIEHGVLQYSEEPKRVILVMSELITACKTVLPQKYWSRAPMTLIATGLRFVPRPSSYKMMEIMRAAIAVSGFKSSSDSVSEMGGRKKIFNWLAVNFLLGRFKRNAGPTVTEMDLGSGATHLAFAPQDLSTLTPSERQLVSSVRVFDRTYSVYAQSLYGLGIDEARKKILEQNKVPDVEDTYKSVCVHPRIVATWYHKTKRYNIQGAVGKDLSVDISACEDTIMTVISRFNASASIYATEVYATSSFYNIIVRAGYKHKNTQLSVKELNARAQLSCRETDSNRPFACMDMLFMKLLLTSTYDLTDTSQVIFAVKFGEHKFSWMIGVGFDMFQREIDMIP